MPAARVIEVFVSPSAAQRLDQAERWLAGQRARFVHRPLLVLADRLATATESIHPQLAASLPPPAADEGLVRAVLFGVHRTTPELLAQELATPLLADRRLAFAGGATHQAVVARALFEVLDELSYFGAVAETPGFTRVLAKTLEELRHHGVTPAQLRALNVLRTTELARLLEAYEAALSDEALVDRAELLVAAAEACQGPPRFAAALLLDLELRRPVEARFLMALYTQGVELTALVPQGDSATLTALATVGELRHLPRATVMQGALCRLQEHLFAEAVSVPSRSAEREDAETAQTAEIEIFSGPTPQAECVEIVRRVIQLVAPSREGPGLKAEQIAILVRQGAPYVELFTEAFARVGLPVFAAEGAYLPDPSGRAFLALLRCAAEGLPAARFAEYLSLGQVPGTPVEEGEDADAAADDGYDDEDDEADVARLAAAPVLPGRWERLIGEAVVGGGGLVRWRDRLRGLREQLASSEAAALADEGEASGRLVGIEHDREQLLRLEAFALPLLGCLEQLCSHDEEGARPSWSDWLALLEPIAVRGLRRPGRVLELLAQLQPLARTGRVPLARVVETLADRLRDLRRPPAKERQGRIYLGLAEEVRGRCFEAVFVAGLAERSFPAKVLQNPILPDALRVALEAGRAALPALPRAAERRAEERSILQLAVGCARRFVGLSYPRMELSPPQPRVPSFYLLEASRAVHGVLPDFEELISEAAQRGAVRLERPFPDEPARAIDAHEYDLSILAEAARLRRDDARTELAGYSGHLHAHAFLVPALRAHWRRGGKSLTGFDGLVAGEAGQRALLGTSLRERAYGVTALERYARCPFAFYLHSVLRLRLPQQLEPAEVLLDAATRGSFFHRVQFELARELRNEGLWPPTETQLDLALARLERAVSMHAATLAEELAPAVDVLWQQEVALLQAELTGWLRREAAAPSGAALHFEYAFGRPLSFQRGARAIDEASTEQPALVGEQGYRLAGAIDLIERRSDGALRVTDYKTGGGPSTSEISALQAGEGLQRVLYGLAYEALAGAGDSADAPIEAVASGRLYFCTERGGYREFEQELTEVVRRQGLDALRAIDEALCEGLLPTVPREGACATCDYRRVCGPGPAEQAPRKLTDKRLAWLRRLREL